MKVCVKEIHTSIKKQFYFIWVATFAIIDAESEFYFDSQIRNSNEEALRSSWLSCGVWVEGYRWVGLKVARGGVVMMWVILTDTRRGGVYALILEKKCYFYTHFYHYE